MCGLPYKQSAASWQKEHDNPSDTHSVNVSQFLKAEIRHNPPLLWLGLISTLYVKEISISVVTEWGVQLTGTSQSFAHDIRLLPNPVCSVGGDYSLQLFFLTKGTSSCETAPGIDPV